MKMQKKLLFIIFQMLREDSGTLNMCEAPPPAAPSLLTLPGSYHVGLQRLCVSQQGGPDWLTRSGLKTKGEQFPSLEE